MEPAARLFQKLLHIKGSETPIVRKVPGLTALSALLSSSIQADMLRLFRNLNTFTLLFCKAEKTPGSVVHSRSFVPYAVIHSILLQKWTRENCAQRGWCASDCKIAEEITPAHLRRFKFAIWECSPPRKIQDSQNMVHSSTSDFETSPLLLCRSISSVTLPFFLLKFVKCKDWGEILRRLTVFPINSRSHPAHWPWKGCWVWPIAAAILLTSVLLGIK